MIVVSRLEHGIQQRAIAQEVKLLPNAWIHDNCCLNGQTLDPTRGKQQWQSPVPWTAPDATRCSPRACAPSQAQVLPQGLRAIAGLVLLRDKVLKLLLAAIANPLGGNPASRKQGRKPKGWTPIDDHYQRLDILPEEWRQIGSETDGVVAERLDLR